ncbi:hypothetical protein DFP72DRAFT_910717 [Ephemerocybe angulata]|uniref:AIG1-type G domain-containing protein n=1 Tax=Ephemerocybe angulata TaxID=980116 RepID=A0A8H6HPZ0_9AGAR|nr:hypothetical protein DFP72DRAFT_910717 [Tulosesus angulatus]
MSETSGSIAILIVGVTGSGKSSFANAFFEAVGHPGRVKVGYTLKSESQDVVAIPVEAQTAGYEHIRGHKLVMVDTPGFDDSGLKPDKEITKKIANWLAESHESNVAIGGVIFLHDISIDREDASNRRARSILLNLCGEEALDRVVMVTSKWARELDTVGPEALHKKEDELKSKHWKSLLRQKEGGGATMRRWNVEKEGETAHAIVRFILKQANDRIGQSGKLEPLLIQKELATGMRFDETRTGSGFLRYLDPRVWLESLRGLFAQLFGPPTRIGREMPRG